MPPLCSKQTVHVRVFNGCYGAMRQDLRRGCDAGGHSRSPAGLLENCRVFSLPMSTGSMATAARQEYGIHIRSLQFVVAAENVASPGLVVSISRHELVTWHSETRDWRRVRVTWNSEVYLVSRASWDSALPIGSPQQASAARRRRWLKLCQSQ
jgi:hypothetical protein